MSILARPEDVKAGAVSNGGSSLDGARQAVTCVGLDLQALAEVEEAIERHGAHYLKRIFTADELAAADSGALPRLAGLAVRFAAKEAVVKALDGGALAFDWRDIEIQATPGGLIAVLSGQLAQRHRDIGSPTLKLSVAAAGPVAAAIVIGFPVPPG